MKSIIMCNPKYFDVVFRINPWMLPNSVDKKLAKKQWRTLLSKYKEYDMDIHVINSVPEYPDMIFAADQGFVYEDNFVISNFRFLERKGESKYYEPRLKELDFKIINLPSDVFLEGGDILKASTNLYFVGYGFRTSSNTPKYIEKLLNVKTESLELINDRFYHLDTCFFILNSDTAFFYPRAFSKSAREKIRKHFKNIFIFSKEEAFNFAANSFRINNKVFIQKGNPLFTNQIENLGYEAVIVDVSEFQKSGGGIHCLTLLIRE